MIKEFDKKNNYKIKSTDFLVHSYILDPKSKNHEFLELKSIFRI